MCKNIVVGANHFSITVGDIDRSVKFYRDMMEMEFENIRYNVNLEYIRKITGYSEGVLNVAFLTTKNLRLELIQYVEPKGKILDVSPHNICSSHICFETNDIFKAYERCEKHGVITKNKPILIDSGPSTGAYAFYMLDPDNYNLELFQPAKVKN